MALEGSLEDMTLVDLFQIFRIGSKSGVLVLNGGTERGLIYVRSGQLIDALVLRGEREVAEVGEAAILSLLRWVQAQFIFRHDLAVADRPIRVFRESEELVLEALRRAETLPALPNQARVTLDARLVLAELPASVQGTTHLDLAQWRMLSQIASYETLREICASSGLTSDSAIRTVIELVALGLVELTPEPVRQLVAPSATRRNGIAALTPQTPFDPGRSSATAVAGGVLLKAIIRRVQRL